MSGADAPVCFDHAASTPPDPAVTRAMTAWLSGADSGANPSSAHAAGRRAAAAVAAARSGLARLLNVRNGSLLFTSGATEADNLAIMGSARFRAHRGRHLITLRTEHKAVIDAFAALEREGFEVSWLVPGSDGRLSLENLQAAIRDDTQLISVMHVNNETGVTQDIAAIGGLCRDRDILYHCDAAQSVGKLPLDVGTLPIDLLSISAHKFHGPQGIGALYIADRPGCGVQPLMHGGGQELRLRPGTLPVHQVVGFGVAAELAAACQATDLRRLRSLRRRLWEGIRTLPGIQLNGADEPEFPGILNVSVADVDGESLLLALDPLCVAAGSACNALDDEPSYVLRALGRSEAEAQGAIRFSLGRTTSEAEVEFAIERYTSAIRRLRALAPAEAAC